MFSRLALPVLVPALVYLSGCAAPSADTEFFGKVEPPEGQVLRYISGSEPTGLDPQIGTGQPEGRIHMALFEGLTDYDPKTSQPIPAIAERWDVNADPSVFVFHLRPTARWSNGAPITRPRLRLQPPPRPRPGPRRAERLHGVLHRVRAGLQRRRDVRPRRKDRRVCSAERLSGDTALRLVLPGAAAARDQQIAGDPKLRAAVAGKELVPGPRRRYRRRSDRRPHIAHHADAIGAVLRRHDGAPFLHGDTQGADRNNTASAGRSPGTS